MGLQYSSAIFDAIEEKKFLNPAVKGSNTGTDREIGAGTLRISKTACLELNLCR
jgi:hypothetical protein